MKETGVKDRILDTASRLFYEQGYHVTGINQIIEEADIARASLYHHFISKTELLLAYLDRSHEAWFRELEDFMRPVEGARERVLALFDHRIMRQSRPNWKGCNFNKIAAENSGDEQVLERVKRHKGRFRTYIRTLVSEAPHKRVLDDEQLADMIFLLLEGATVAGAMFRSYEETEKAKKIVESFL